MATAPKRPRGRPAAADRSEVMALATAQFLSGRRIDVQAIAAELGLSRATIYRWYGSRDRLVGDGQCAVRHPGRDRRVPGRG